MPGAENAVKCSCGNEFNPGRAKRKSCGSCKIFKWKNYGPWKFGLLTLADDPKSFDKLNDKARWLCDCGGEKTAAIKSVLSGLTKSCGCILGTKSSENLTKAKSRVEYSSEHWLSKIPELVDRGLPASWSEGSGKEMFFRCACGSEYQRRFFKFKTGISTCGSCTDRKIQHGDKIGNFVYLGDKKTIKSDSDSKDLFRCECGREFELSIRLAFLGKQKHCLKCGVKNEEWWKNRKFGFLKVCDPKEASKWPTKSEKILNWECSCGNVHTARIDQVTSGGVKSCGKCIKTAFLWFERVKPTLNALKAPVIPSEWPEGGPELLEMSGSLSDVTKFKCWLCKREYNTRISDIINGKSLSCGCASGSVSKANLEIYTYIKSLGFNSKIEYKINGMSYDVAIPELNLVIEHQGLKWHSLPNSKERDLKKYQNAVENGWSYLAIYEDEWLKKREICKEIIKNKIGKSSRISVRPSKCQIRKIEFQEASEFYEKYHYIGKCNAKIHYGIFYQDKLIACASVRKPVRQTISYEWEIARMAASGEFQVHGIWSKVFKKFISEYNPTSVVSYSDNRLFSGSVYSKLGFILDGDVSSDYFWTKGTKRFHKSGLRKDGPLTETELRESQGYRKIWDLGKKRWTWLAERVKK